MRSGVIAQKLGMTRLFTDAGEQVPVTVLKLEQLPGRRPAHRGEERLHRRSSSASGARKVKRTPKAMRGHFAVAKVEPKRKVAEFRVSAGQPDRRRRRDHRRSFRRRPVRRCHRHVDRQGLCRRHEALQLRRPARHARRLGLAPLARFDRPAPGSRQGLQGQEDGRPHGRRARHHAEPAESSRPTSSAA